MLGLFSLIFTQIVSILYLYIDTRALATGKKDLVLEVVVTGVLMLANVLIVVAMVGSYVVAWKRHCRRRRIVELCNSSLRSASSPWVR